jgi:hypothetical protein
VALCGIVRESTKESLGKGTLTRLPTEHLHDEFCGPPANTPESAESKIERCLISTFQVAESMGFQGDFRQWEHLLRIGD